MTIQEMFNLLRDYRDAVCKEHNAAIMGAKDLVNTMIHTQHIANEVFLYLPQFTPMSCKLCKHTGCNRKRDRGVCGEYEVELLKPE